MNKSSASIHFKPLAAKLQQVAHILDQSFIDKQEIIRLLIISIIAGEHLLLVGPPGTAKSALIRTFSRLLHAKYFEYLLTRFTEPNEIFGPVDMVAFREGNFRRRISGMLPEAEIVFLDEVFKANSAILNSLLTLLNERHYANGSQIITCPLLSAFGASNEIPNDDNLQAMFDRFLLRVKSTNLDSYHFHNLIVRGISNEMRLITHQAVEQQPSIDSHELHLVHQNYPQLMKFPDAFLTTYKGLIFQIRSEGISVSDRRAVKLMKLFAANALFDGRENVCEADFFVLKHVWNSLDQTDILNEIVNPVLDRYFRDHPEKRRFFGTQAGLEDLLSELKMIRDLLTSGQTLSDIQLFSQLRNLGQIKAALQSIDNDTARHMVSQVDTLLESIFSSSKFV